MPLVPEIDGGRQDAELSPNCPVANRSPPGNVIVARCSPDFRERLFGPEWQKRHDRVSDTRWILDLGSVLVRIGAQDLRACERMEITFPLFSSVFCGNVFGELFISFIALIFAAACTDKSGLDDPDALFWVEPEPGWFSRSRHSFFAIDALIAPAVTKLRLPYLTICKFPRSLSALRVSGVIAPRKKISQASSSVNSSLSSMSAVEINSPPHRTCRSRCRPPSSPGAVRAQTVQGAEHRCRHSAPLPYRTHQACANARAGAR